MTRSWREVALADVADEVTVGHVGPMASEYVEEGVPFLRSLNVREHRLDLVEVKYISEEFHAKLRKSALGPGDVVTVRTGKPGVTAVIPESLPEANCSDLVITRPGPDLDARWLSYFMNGAANGYVASRLVGAVQQHFNVSSAKELRLLLPPIVEQQAIAATVGTLDDKIESNDRLVALILDLIEARVRQALDEDRVAVPVSALGTFVNGGAYTKDAAGTGRLVIRIAELNKGPGPSTVYNDLDVPDDKTARSGDILMSWSGSLGVYRWAREEAIINQHIFKVIPGGYPAWLVFDRLNAAIEVFRGIAQDKATTMGHIQRSHLETTFVDVPTDSAIKVLDNDLGPLWDRLLLAERESLNLAALRDALLPALLSGAIRVSDENNSMTGADDEGER